MVINIQRRFHVRKRRGKAKPELIFKNGLGVEGVDFPTTITCAIAAIDRLRKVNGATGIAHIELILQGMNVVPVISILDLEFDPHQMKGGWRKGKTRKPGIYADDLT